MIALWLCGLVRRRPLRLLATALGVAIAVALVASLGSFLTQSKATMTDRAVRDVVVDWQVQVQPQADAADIAHLVSSDPHTRVATPVGYAKVDALASVTGASSQTTSTATVLGLPDNYRMLFPGEIRSLVGRPDGVMLAQQTASNLHVAPGDTMTINRYGLAPVAVRVDGIVELPQANSLFQTVGAPPGAQPQAPPDNVVLLPENQWHQLFNPMALMRPDAVSIQIHAARDHSLPADPAAAYTAATASVRNLEAQSAGGALVGDNLAAALDSARADAAYAQILFIFLAVPGVVLAGVVTATITTAGADRRRAEQALLRARGASSRQVLRLARAESALIGAFGAALGLVGAAVVGKVAFGAARFGTSAASYIVWAAASAAVGIAIAALAVVVPVRCDVRERTVAAGRDRLPLQRFPWWARYGLDISAVLLAGLVYAITSRTGYQLVLAPEGTPTISVSYWAFAGPALLWLGAALLTWRFADLLLGGGRAIVQRALRPVTGSLAGVIANGMSRQRRPLVRAVVVLAMATGFAVSTATFNATYRQQAEIDALLTGGADVAVNHGPSAQIGPAQGDRLRAVPGVKGVEPLQHRYAYVGSELQDFYGVYPATITRATALQDAYFHGDTAAGFMKTLAARPESILVSAETVMVYQLHVGDQITLRLTDAHSGQQKSVPFRYVGVVNEFPTAPRDSFFVANADYVARKTGSDAVGTFLVDTGGVDTTAVAARIADMLGPTATVTDIATVRGRVGSSLTSVDLDGLTRLELSFALALGVAAGGLALALGLAERRRSFAIFTALGGQSRHLRAVVFSEAGALTLLGLACGALIGAALSVMLVKVLSGVFDPPPSNIPVPWPYLAVFAATTVGALAIAAAAAVRTARRSDTALLRDP
jgi:putative ABC transport system permease protein